MSKKEFILPSGEKIIYEMSNGKTVYIAVGEHAYSPVSAQLTLHGVQYAFASTTLRYGNGKWDVMYNVTAQVFPCTKNGYGYNFYNALSSQEVIDLTKFFVSFWESFCTFEMMLEADIEKCKNEIDYFDGKIKKAQKQIEKLEEKKKKGEIKQKKAQARLDEYLKGKSISAVPQTPVPAVVVSNP